MSKTVELAKKLEKLHINNMYKTDFFWTWDKTDDEIEAVFTVADALRDLRERNKSTKVFNSGLGISLFRDRPRDRQHGLVHGRRHRHPRRHVHPSGS